MNFKDYTLIIEAMLEDLWVSDDPKENIELLHEMEYKIHKIAENRYSMNPKLYVNLIKRFGELATEAYDELHPKFEELFQYWLNMHRTDDPYLWSKYIYDQAMDNDESATTFGAGRHVMTLDEMVKRANVDNEDDTSIIQSILDHNFYNDGEMFEFFAYSVGAYLNEKKVPIPADVNEEEEWDVRYYWTENVEDAVEYIYEHDLEEPAKKYIYSIVTADELISERGLEADPKTVIDLISKTLYQDYYDEFGISIESVTYDIEEAEKKLSEVEDFSNKMTNTVLNLHPDDSNLDNTVKDIIKIVGEMTSTISLAMGTMHVTGNIVTDYGDCVGFDDIDIDYLENFNNREVDDWDDDLKKIIK